MYSYRRTFENAINKSGSGERSLLEKRKLAKNLEAFLKSLHTQALVCQNLFMQVKELKRQQDPSPPGRPYVRDPDALDDTLNVLAKALIESEKSLGINLSDLEDHITWLENQ